MDFLHQLSSQQRIGEGWIWTHTHRLGILYLIRGWIFPWRSWNIRTALSRQAEQGHLSHVFSNLTVYCWNWNRIEKQTIHQAWVWQNYKQASYRDLAFSFPLVALFSPDLLPISQASPQLCLSTAIYLFMPRDKKGHFTTICRKQGLVQTSVLPP